MKKHLLLVIIGAFPLIGLSQIKVNTALLNENNVGITLSDGGVFLAKPDGSVENSQQMTLPGCEYPVGSGNHLISGLSMWFGGVNEFNEPRISAPTDVAYEDQFGGAMWGTQGPIFGHAGMNLVSISREEINYHITNFQNPNYIVPDKIMNWPAHGDVSHGMSFYLAPFVDLNGDGIYEPWIGEYPCIQGDRAVYIILNDHNGDQLCAGPLNSESLGIEIHYLFYQYSSIPELANTTFCKARVINRSTSNYTDFVTSVFMTPEIGLSHDDKAGTDIERNLLYAYNGGQVDVDYGTQPPAVGIVSLNRDISRTRIFGNEEHDSYNFPSNAAEFLQVMQGKLLSGKSHPEPFAYPGDPVLNQGILQPESEEGQSMIYSIDAGDLNSGEELAFDFAIVVGQGESNLASVQRLKQDVDFVREFYREDEGLCYAGIIGTPAIIDPPTSPYTLSGETTMYPNPSNGVFTIEVEEEWIGADLNVFSASGKILQSTTKVTELLSSITLIDGPGVYLVTLEKDGESKLFKAVIE